MLEFKYIQALALLSSYLYFGGFGIYVLLVPDYLKNNNSIYYSPIILGIILQTIACSYTIALNLHIIYSVPLVAIIGAATAVYCIVNNKSIKFLISGFSKPDKEIIVASIFLFCSLLYPAFGSDVMTTPYRIGIDHAGYAGTATYLVQGGSLEKSATTIKLQTGSKDLDDALEKNYTALSFNAAVDSDYLLKAARGNFPGVLSVYTMLTSSSHVYEIQFLSSILSYILFFAALYDLFLQHFIKNKIAASALALAVAFNCQLLNELYEGISAHIFAMPVLALLMSTYIVFKKNMDFSLFGFLEFRSDIALFKKTLWLVFLFSGLIVSYNEGVILLLILFCVTAAVDLVFRNKTSRCVFPYIVLTFVFGTIVCAPQTLALLHYILGPHLKYFVTNAGFWMPHVAFPSEIVGLFNMFVPEYTTKAPAALPRSIGNAFANIVLSMVVVALYARCYLKSEKALKSFWIGIGLLVLFFMVRSFIGETASSAYVYMKVYTTIVPYILLALYLGLNSLPSHLKNNRIVGILGFVSFFAIVCSGLSYIVQFKKECRLVTKDMYQLAQDSERNFNFSDYALITNKGTIDEFIVTALIPFQWINQGTGKYLIPHGEKKVALFIDKRSVDPAISRDQLKGVVAYENKSYLILDTESVLADSIYAATGKFNLPYFHKEYPVFFK